jgi:hypothetical protein
VTVHGPVTQVADGQEIPGQPGTVSHNWVVDFDNQTADAATLAGQVIAFWDSWLTQHRLL